MSPVCSLIPSPTASGFTARRRARPSSAFLFPVCPVSPKQRVEELAPLPGPGSTVLDARKADCSPPTPAHHGGSTLRDVSDFQKAAVDALPDVASGASAPLVGIARLASISPAAPTRRKSEDRPEYFFLPVKSILNRCESNRVPFDWTINPYWGCEFACKYCYARYTHEFMEMDGVAFEKKIYVKKDAAVLLARDIATKYLFAVGSAGAPEHICIGTATDPYQPAEREYGVTRACLEELAKREGLSVSVITKSNQIVRDIDLFKRIAERSELSLNITITTLRTRLARLLEPKAPRPDLRLAAVKQLREAGLAVGVSASPLVPGITDRDGDLEAVASAAHEAGAQWFFSGVLFLMPSSAKQFLPFIREKFPKLATQYEQWYAKNGYAPEEYRKEVSEQVARIRQKYGFGSREKRKAMPYAQMSLSWNA